MAPFTATSDLDPRAEYYWVNLAWGHNFVKTAGGATMLDEGSFITGYTVKVVDQYGDAKAATIVDVPATGGMVDCCYSNQYTVSIAGKFPVGADRFMIVPYHGSGDAKTYMPLGTITAKLVDIATGSATEVVQSLAMLGMTQADATAFVDNPASKQVMVKGVVAAIADSKITKDNVIVTKLEARETAAARRLGESKGRRLSGWQVNAQYKILLPADYTGTITADSVNKEVLKATVTTEYQKETGSAITVGSVTVTEPVTTTVTDDGGSATGAAHPSTGNCLFSFLALALAFAGQQRLA